MKALMCNAPGSVSIVDAPQPRPAPNEALVRVASVGICGSDVHAYHGHDERRPLPLVLGHEIAGTVVESQDSKTGRRVAVNPLITCGHCDDCKNGRNNLCAQRQILSMPPRPGGFAEFVAAPEENLVDIPDAVSFPQAALTEPLACGWHAARRGREYLGTARADEATALVIGGGAIGLGAALCLFAQGTENIAITEPQPQRREYLTQKCGQRAVEPAQLKAEGKFQFVIDAVGNETSRAAACAHARAGGVIVHIGLGSPAGGVDARRLTLQEIAFIGTYTYTADDFQQTARAMFAGKLGALDWTMERPLEEGAAAFADICGGITAEPKTILNP